MAFNVDDLVVVKKLGGQGGAKQVMPDIFGKIKTVEANSEYTIQYTTNVDRVRGEMSYPSGLVPEAVIHAA